MGLLLDTNQFRPIVGIYQVRYSAAGTGHTPAIPRRSAVAAAPAYATAALLEVCWIVDERGQLTCSWCETVTA